MKKIILSLLTLFCALGAQAQTKSTFIHMKSGEIREIQNTQIDSITFAEHIDFDKDIKATSTLGIYYGTYNEAGEFLLALSDAEITAQGYPTKVGQSLIMFYAMGEPATDPKDIQFSSGQYTPASDFSKFSLYNGDGYLIYEYCTGFDEEGYPEGWAFTLDYATLNVKNNGGSYYIDFKGGIEDRYTDTSEGIDFKDVHLVYEGPIAFKNQDPSYYEPLTQDYDIVPTAMSARYTCTPSYGYGNYSFAFFNTPIDDEGYIIGAGDVIGMELLTNPSVPMDLEDLNGEYTVASILEGPYTPGHFLSGVNYEYYGNYFAMGTYLNFYDETGSPTSNIGFVTGGTAKISVDGTNITYDFDFIVEGDHHVRMKMTASSETIYDYTSSSAKPNAPAKKSPFQSVKILKGRNLMAPQSTLRLVKKQ